MYVRTYIHTYIHTYICIVCIMSVHSTYPRQFVINEAYSALSRPPILKILYYYTFVWERRPTKVAYEVLKLKPAEEKEWK